MSDKKMKRIQNEITELLIPELPVLRAKARISQEEIAKKIGISRQTYSSIETGRRSISWTIALAIIAYFQNNEETVDMINNIDGLLEKIQIVTE